MYLQPSFVLVVVASWVMMCAAQQCTIHCARGCCYTNQVCCQPNPTRGPTCCNTSFQVCLRDYQTCVAVTPIPPAPTPYVPGELIWADKAETSNTHVVGSLGDDIAIATTGAGLQAFHAATGAVMWTYPHPASGVVQNGSTLYFTAVGMSWPAGVVVALDAETGSVRWSTTVPNVVNDVLLTESESPMLFVRVQDDDDISGMFALFASNGSVAWNTTSFFRAMPASIGSVCTLSNDVYTIGVRCTTGETVWSTQRTVAGSGSTSIYPLANRGLFLLYFDEWSSVEITALRAADGGVVWNHTHLFGSGSLAIAADQSSFFTVTSNDLYINYVDRYDTADGTLLWRLATPTDSYNNVNIMLVTPSIVLLAYYEYTFAAFANNGSTVWNASYGISSHTVATSSTSSTAYAGVGGSIVAIDLSSGGWLWSHATQLTVQHAPVPVGAYVVAGSLDTYLYGVFRGNS